MVTWESSSWPSCHRKLLFLDVSKYRDFTLLVTVRISEISDADSELPN